MGRGRSRSRSASCIHRGWGRGHWDRGGALASLAPSSEPGLSPWAGGRPLVGARIYGKLIFKPVSERERDGVGEIFPRWRQTRLQRN
ncbi:hypothetical protein chiPu_0009706 [Chiloscyllium punctatum]|uniref:Uncharacterized protein n=1 Tax=Chiloscyllium punctatum TaxID=137246 RepID=A0A401SLJ0_CHIPU|nr:hypothetical protein [Chiloscyllium punctatum]